MSQTKSNTLLVAGSILAAGVVIALGIMLAGGSEGPQVDENTLREVAIADVSPKDHIQGNMDARVVMVEYSDIGCSHCQNLHSVMNQVVEEYDGEDFAWVYRHLPFRAPTEAHASECIADQAGEEAFWSFLNQAMEQAQTRPITSEEELEALAFSIEGVDEDAFRECQDDSTFVNTVQDHARDAQEAGAQGTPFNVFILQEALSVEKEAQLQSLFGGNLRLSEDKTRVVLSGGMPYEGITALIDTFLE